MASNCLSNMSAKDSNCGPALSDAGPISWTFTGMVMAAATGRGLRVRGGECYSALQQSTEEEITLDAAALL